MNFDPKKPWIKLSGERIFVHPAMPFFKRLVYALYTDTMIIKKAGAKLFFMEQGKMMLSILLKEKKRFVMVLHEDDLLKKGKDDLFQGSVNNYTHTHTHTHTV